MQVCANMHMQGQPGVWLPPQPLLGRRAVGQEGAEQRLAPLTTGSEVPQLPPPLEKQPFLLLVSAKVHTITQTSASEHPNGPTPAQTAGAASVNTVIRAHAASVLREETQ